MKIFDEKDHFEIQSIELTPKNYINFIYLLYQFTYFEFSIIRKIYNLINQNQKSPQMLIVFKNLKF